MPQLLTKGLQKKVQICFKFKWVDLCGCQIYEGTKAFLNHQQTSGIWQFLLWVLLSSRTPSPYMSDHGSQPIPGGSMSVGNMQSVLSEWQRYNPLQVGPLINPLWIRDSHIIGDLLFLLRLPTFHLLSAHPAIAYSLVRSPIIWYLIYQPRLHLLMSIHNPWPYLSMEGFTMKVLKLLYLWTQMIPHVFLVDVPALFVPGDVSKITLK